MRSVSPLLALTLVTSPAWAAPAVITENIAAVVSGSHTIDTAGYFGTRGADLSGAKAAIYLQYVPKLFGPSQDCRNHSCTYNESLKTADTQGSLLVTIAINGHRKVYSPTMEGVLFFPLQSPYQLTIDADAFSGFGVGLPGVQLGVELVSAPEFGQSLSPDDGPVMQESTSDVVDFFDASSQTPVEQLSFTPTGASK